MVASLIQDLANWAVFYYLKFSYFELLGFFFSFLRKIICLSDVQWNTGAPWFSVLFKKKKKTQSIVARGFSLACQAGIKISLESSFAWFMCQADMSWISLQKGPESIRHQRRLEGKSPQKKSLWFLYSSTPLSFPLLYKNWSKGQMKERFLSLD